MLHCAVTRPTAGDKIPHKVPRKFTRALHHELVPALLRPPRIPGFPLIGTVGGGDESGGGGHFQRDLRRRAGAAPQRGAGAAHDGALAAAAGGRAHRGGAEPHAGRHRGGRDREEGRGGADKSVISPQQASLPLSEKNDSIQHLLTGDACPGRPPVTSERRRCGARQRIGLFDTGSTTGHMWRPQMIEWRINFRPEVVK
eukprot:1195066-Prorocentrum_minimum.AAC.6